MCIQISVQTHLMADFNGISSELIKSYQGFIAYGAKTTNGSNDWLPDSCSNLYRSSARPIIP